MSRVIRSDLLTRDERRTARRTAATASWPAFPVTVS